MGAAYHRARGGFTLFEVLIALAVLSSITALTYTALAGTITLTEVAREDEAAVNGGRIAMQRIGREVRMAFLDRGVYSRGRSQVGGTVVETYRTLFKAEDTAPMDELTFTTFSHVRLYHGSKEGDQTEISYFGEPDDDNPGLYKLMHREAPRIDEEPEEGGRVEVLARGVEKFDLQFYDYRRQEWVDEWDDESAETRRRPPRAVAISLVLIDSNGAAHPFRTKVELPLKRSLNRNLRGQSTTRNNSSRRNNNTAPPGAPQLPFGGGNSGFPTTGGGLPPGGNLNTAGGLGR